MSSQYQSPADIGTFVVSLDFELAWGTRGRATAHRVAPYLDGTRDAVAKLLGLCAQYDVSATWVMVGALALGGQERHPWLDSPEFDDVPLGDHRSAHRWYADDLIEQLRAAPTPQDLGCHTLTHIFVRDTPEGRVEFDRELARSVELFRQLGLPRPRSFIFPKHYMAHFDLLAKHGFTCYRGPESGWFERLPGARTRAALRLLDARLRRPPVVRRARKTEDGLWEIPSSQYYSAFQSVGRWVGLADRVAKAKAGLDRAAERQGVYHLWTHPFNLGCRTDELLAGLQEIFEYADRLRGEGKLAIQSMAGLSESLETAAEPAPC